MSTRGRPKLPPRVVAHNPAEPCSYSTYQCSLPRIETYEFCIRHILEDKTAPFRQCNFTYVSSSKRCFRAAPIVDKDGYCKEHSRKIARQRHKSVLKPKASGSPESCLDQLSSRHVLPVSCLYSVPDAANFPSIAASALECGSDDESDSEIFDKIDVNALSRLEDDIEVDSATEFEYDLLDHAEVFTEEEVIQMYTSKLQKLRSLYTDEFKNLTRILKGAKRDYYMNVKNEKETMGSIHSQPKESADDQECYRDLQSLLSYHRHKGKDALVHRQFLEKKRMVEEGADYKVPALPVGCVKCTYNEGSWRCGEKSIPLSKYCSKHILQDSNQVLFKPCGSAPGGNETCQVPVMMSPFSDSCIYHTPIPNLLPVSNPTSAEELSQLPLEIAPPRIIGLSDSSAFVVSELPPDNVMEGDALDQSEASDVEQIIV